MDQEDHMKKKLIPTLLTSLVVSMYGGASCAAVVATPSTTITYLSILSEYGNGDVTFVTATLVSGCDGFWLRRIDAGFKELYAALIMAYATKVPTVVHAHNDSIWPGSGSPFCRVYAMTPQ
jgi:hypothetical protein